MERAFEWMDYARLLDTQDRFLNTKCVRYAHRAGKPDAADQIVSLFLRVRLDIIFFFEICFACLFVCDWWRQKREITVMIH